MPLKYKNIVFFNADPVCPKKWSQKWCFYLILKNRFWYGSEEHQKKSKKSVKKITVFSLNIF